MNDQTNLPVPAGLAKSNITAGMPVRALIPSDFDGAWRIAVAVCAASMAPKDLDTPAKAMVAIMHGLEVGLPPMMALQSIAVINGRPSIYGDGALGLVRGSGLLEWVEERVEQEADGKPVAICTVKRKGEVKPITRTFSQADAELAGLWGKSGPWQTYRKRMLGMRARAWALRDGFADVLKGLSIHEEMEDVEHMKDVTPRPAATPPEPPPDETKPVEATDTGGKVIWSDNSAASSEGQTSPPVPPTPPDDPSDPGPLPGFLDRNGARPTLTPDAAFLEEIANVASGIEDLKELSEAQRERMPEDRRAAVSEEAWHKAQDIFISRATAINGVT